MFCFQVHQSQLLLYWIENFISPMFYVLFLMQCFLSDTHHSNFATLSSFTFDFDAAADVTKFLPKENTRMINMQMCPKLGICAAFSRQIPNFYVFFLLFPYFMFSLFPNCQMIKEILIYIIICKCRQVFSGCYIFVYKHF